VIASKTLLSYLFICCITGTLFTQNVPFPAPGHEGLNTKKISEINLEESSHLQFGFWTQNRIMYNLSNIPGPGGTDFGNTSSYDFFRQRFRTAFDVRFVDTTRTVQAGVYTQLEYRGGWGGSSPLTSDPRDVGVINNPYNRLQSRGVRYGFVYFESKEKTIIAAGILPLTDGIGRVLFDADWDFNVGGISVGGPLFKKGNYRLAYVRLIDGIGSQSPDEINSNGNLILIDETYPLNNNLTLGTHVYGLIIPEDLNVSTVKNQLWLGMTLTGKSNSFQYDGMFIFNSGKIEGQRHNGLATKVGLNLAIGNGKLSFIGMMSTGDDESEVDNRFVTLYQIIGTAGYWGLSDIYTPNGPSDVNDFGLEIGNRGAGLATLQTKYGFPLVTDKLNANLHVGWFRALKPRNSSKDLGIEIGGMLTFTFVKYLHLEFGAAYASVGDHIAVDADKVFEVFSRFQFTW
jgi:hypothetical protein